MSAGAYKCCGCGWNGDGNVPCPVAATPAPSGSWEDLLFHSLNTELLCASCGGTGPVNCGFVPRVVDCGEGFSQTRIHPEPLECCCGTVDDHVWCPRCRGFNGRPPKVPAMQPAEDDV